MSEPIECCQQFTFDGCEVTVCYDANLSRRGETRDCQTDHPTIVLREWDERVFLHELLHVALDKRLIEYHAGADWESLDGTLTAPRERIVGEVETALWDFGWRWTSRP